VNTALPVLQTALQKDPRGPAKRASSGAGQGGDIALAVTLEAWLVSDAKREVDLYKKRLRQWMAR
jgi:hypothetical protein